VILRNKVTAKHRSICSNHYSKKKEVSIVASQQPNHAPKWGSTIEIESRCLDQLTYACFDLHLLQQQRRGDLCWWQRFSLENDLKVSLFIQSSACAAGELCLLFGVAVKSLKDGSSMQQKWLPYVHNAVSCKYAPPGVAAASRMSMLLEYSVLYVPTYCVRCVTSDERTTNQRPSNQWPTSM
jgi:hypothetical protein